MSQHDLEYAIAVFQRGTLTFAAKEHRRRKGNPLLTINLMGTYVEWIITPLTQGIQSTNTGVPQKNRFDMYFLLQEACEKTASWQSTGVKPAMWSKAHNNQGTERPGGKTIKMEIPIGQLSGITSLDAQVDITGSPFTASAANLTLYADMEYTPAGKEYTSEVTQLHFGFKSDTYTFTAGAAAATNQVVIKMPNDVYEAIRVQLISLCKSI